MDVHVILQVAFGTITQLNDARIAGHSLQGFEILAYEQACRMVETLMRDYRVEWEKQHGTGEDPS